MHLMAVQTEKGVKDYVHSDNSAHAEEFELMKEFLFAVGRKHKLDETHINICETPQHREDGTQPAYDLTISVHFKSATQDAQIDRANQLLRLDVFNKTL